MVFSQFVVPSSGRERLQKPKHHALFLAMPNTLQTLCCWGVVFALLLGLHETAEATLNQQLSVTWRELPLQMALDRLAQVSQVTVWLDRRVDPQQQIDLELRDASTQQILQQLAQHCDLGFLVVDSIVYLGPKQSAHDLPVLLQQARKSLSKAPRQMRKRWLRAEAKTIPRLAQPRRWLAQSLNEAGISLLDQEKIPHDLWRKKELPPLAMVDRIVLLLVGFDRTCEMTPDGKTCRIVAISHPVAIGRKSKKGLPQRPLQRRPSGAVQKVFSLRLQNQPVGQVVEQLARQLQLEVLWDEPTASGKAISRKTPISCEVHNASLEELLQSVLTPAGLQFQWQGKKIKIQTIAQPSAATKKAEP